MEAAEDSEVLTQQILDSALSTTRKQRLLTSLISGGTQEFRCLWSNFMAVSVPRPEADASHCDAEWDGLACFPITSAGVTVTLPCTELELHDIPVQDQAFFNNLKFHRNCTGRGVWEQSIDYHECMEYLEKNLQFLENQHSNVTELTLNISGAGDADIQRTHQLVPEDVRQAVIYVSFIGSIVSLLFLTISLTIFCTFRSLQCARLSIHKHLVTAFIFRFVILFIIFEPYASQRAVGDSPSYLSETWVCKTIHILNIYTISVCIYWFLVEGFFLLTRVTTNVFATESNFRLYIYCLFGWAAPLLFIVPWVILMSHYTKPGYVDPCWANYTSSGYGYLLIAPIFLALIVNLLFLLVIVYIVITKLRATNAAENNQLKKAVRAFATLFPILGLTNLLYFVKPGDQGIGDYTYYIVNSLLQSSQGIFIALIHCFLNSEVRDCLHRAYRRHRLTRFPHRTSGVSNKSRTSVQTTSFFLTSAEVPRFLLICSKFLCLNKESQGHIERSASEIGGDDDDDDYRLATAYHLDQPRPHELPSSDMQLIATALLGDDRSKETLDSNGREIEQQRTCVH